SPITRDRQEQRVRTTGVAGGRSPSQPIGDAMRFLVLGPLGVVDGNTDLTPTAPKVREVLALLLLRHNRLVPTSSIIDELWPENPPASAMQTLQTYIYKIRKSLTRREDGDDLLITK